MSTVGPISPAGRSPSDFTRRPAHDQRRDNVEILYEVKFDHKGDPRSMARIQDTLAKLGVGAVELRIKGGVAGRIRACQMNPSKSLVLSENAESGATSGYPESGQTLPSSGNGKIVSEVA